MRQVILVICMIIAIIPTVFGATVHGNVYDLALDIVDGAVIIVDSKPEQIAVAKNGEYSFELGKGEYLIQGIFLNGEELYYEHKIKIEDSKGTYKIDLILLPDENELNIDDLTELFPEDKEPIKENHYFIWGLVIIVVIISGLWWLKKSKKNLKEQKELPGEGDELKEKIFQFIKDEGGRVTQKDIRKKFPLSEAKISLVITELEDNKKVKKIKRGRGNIIVLQK